MIRVIKPGGHLYLSVPSNGKYHSHPYDNWRFYPDAALALQRWAERQGSAVALVESFVLPRIADVWNDCVIVFRKGREPPDPARPRIVDRYPAAFNIRRAAVPGVENYSEASEDMILLERARQECHRLERRLAGDAGRIGADDGWRQEVAALRDAVAGLQAEVKRLSAAIGAPRGNWSRQAALELAGRWADLPQPPAPSLVNEAAAAFERFLAAGREGAGASPELRRAALDAAVSAAPGQLTITMAWATRFLSSGNGAARPSRARGAREGVP
jgi:hypothetical protein